MRSPGTSLTVFDSRSILITDRKYLGYRAFSTYMASDTDYFAIRRFDNLFTRTILSRQDNLSHLEEKLEELDNKYTYSEERDYHNGTIRDDLPERKELVKEISQILPEYCSPGLFSVYLYSK